MSELIIIFSGMWQRAGRVVRVAVPPTALRAGVSSYCDALRSSWLYGQSAQVHREGACADRQADWYVGINLLGLLPLVAPKVGGLWEAVVMSV